MIGNSQARANKSCLSEDRQQLFFYLDTFHPTTKVVELLANFYSDTNALSTYESLQHECVNSDCYPQNVSLVLAFHPTVETVGFPGLHFVKVRNYGLLFLLFLVGVQNLFQNVVIKIVKEQTGFFIRFRSSENTVSFS